MYSTMKKLTAASGAVSINVRAINPIIRCVTANNANTGGPKRIGEAVSDKRWLPPEAFNVTGSAALGDHQPGFGDMLG